MPKGIPVKHPGEDAIRTQIQVGDPTYASLARHFRCARKSIKKWIEESDELKELFEEQRDSLVDEAEVQLRRAVKDGDMKAVIFTLRTLGRERGYTTRVELDGSLEHRGTVSIVLPHNNRDELPGDASQRTDDNA